ncbi:Signal transduction histidine kinase CheA [hydrothermal vent metagenome]|uniref:Signal transduction histidine kinase CheA n=1 Tax=hydrothermal vent metagenome TaxID=652676 RepID=A0A3B0ZGX1_9ZZZZ
MSPSNDSLENYFPGNKRWNDFVSCFENEWVECDFQNELIEQLSNNVDIAKVIYASVGTIALDWIKETVPALENLSPSECLKSFNGTRRLKTMLMRMPR